MITDSSGLDYIFDYIRPTILIYDKEYESDVKESLKRLKIQEIKMCLVYGNPSSENSIENVLLKKERTSNFKPVDLSQYESPDDLTACIYFSSGTTGRPKGVKISHSLLLNEINGLAGTPQFNDPNMNMLAASTLRWISQLSVMMIPIFFGAKRTITGKENNPENICSAIDKWKVTSLLGSNQILNSIFDHYSRSFYYDFSFLRTVVTSGEAPSKSINDRIQRILPNIDVTYRYGLSECGGAVAMQNDLGLLNGGHIVKGFSFRIVDEQGSNLGPGMPGIVHIKGRGKFTGYYKNEEATKKATTDDGWYNTGDYGLFTQNNYLHIYCRFDSIPKCNGKLIIPIHVEEHLHKHNNVNFAVMVPVSGITPHNQRIAVYVKLNENVVDKLHSKTELIEYLKEIIDWEIVAKFEIVKGFEASFSGKSKIVIPLTE